MDHRASTTLHAEAAHAAKNRLVVRLRLDGGLHLRARDAMMADLAWNEKIVWSSSRKAQMTHRMMAGQKIAAIQLATAGWTSAAIAAACAASSPDCWPWRVAAVVFAAAVKPM